MTETTPPVGYIIGLDTWRAALMLGGVVLHGSIGLPALGLFVAIDMISQTFRMGTFFGIAGILTAIALAKRAPGDWLRRRLVRLGFPLAFGLFILSPFIWLMRTAAGDIAATDTLFNWYHLWFLAALIAYSTIIYALIRLRLDEALETYLVDLIARKTVRSSTVLLFTAVTSATLFGIAPRIMAATMSDSTFATFRMLQLAAGYLPMFLLGYLVGRVPALKSLLLHQTRTATMIALAITSSYMIWFGLIAPYAKSAIVAAGTADLRFVAAAIGPPAAFVLILRSALRVRSVPSLVQRVSAASYTIYVLHLPLVVAINLALRDSMVNIYFIYVISVIISASIAFAFHEVIVSRSSILLLVLNGNVKRHMAKNARIGASISHQNEDAEIRFIPGVTATPGLQAPEHDLDFAQRL